jgi:ribosomal protein L18
VTASDLGKPNLKGLDWISFITKELAKLKAAKVAAVFLIVACKYHGRVKAVAETLRQEGITV